MSSQSDNLLNLRRLPNHVRREMRANQQPTSTRATRATRATRTHKTLTNQRLVDQLAKHDYRQSSAFEYAEDDALIFIGGRRINDVNETYYNVCALLRARSKVPVHFTPAGIDIDPANW